MHEEIRLTLRNDVRELARVHSLASRVLERGSIAADAVYATQLALEEILSNVIRHGYEETGSHEISVHLRVGDGAVDLEVEDEALPVKIGLLETRLEAKKSRLSEIQKQLLQRIQAAEAAALTAKKYAEDEIAALKQSLEEGVNKRGERWFNIGMAIIGVAASLLTTYLTVKFGLSGGGSSASHGP